MYVCMNVDMMVHELTIAVCLFGLAVRRPVVGRRELVRHQLR